MTPIAKAKIGLSICGAKNKVAQIKDRFKRIGTAAGIANSFHVFKMDELRATIDIKKMYGNIILVNWLAVVNVCGSSYKPEAIIQTRIGAHREPKTLIRRTTLANKLATLSINVLASSCALVDFASASIGTKAC